MKYIKSFESIRNNYTKVGVDDFYKSNTETYINPHESKVQKCLDWSVDKIQVGKFLDLSCGNGEVSSYLSSLGFNNFKGSDPYLNNTYTKKTGKECFKLRFEDISTKGLSEKFDTIICSYALHLCPDSYFDTLLYNLSINCKYFIVISPSKFPTINENYFELVDSIIIERSHCRIFKSKSELVNEKVGNELSTKWYLKNLLRKIRTVTTKLDFKFEIEGSSYRLTINHIDSTYDKKVINLINKYKDELSKIGVQLAYTSTESYSDVEIGDDLSITVGDYNKKDITYHLYIKDIYVKRIKPSRYVYHSTNKSNRESIFSKGLLTSKNLNYKDSTSLEHPPAVFATNHSPLWKLQGSDIWKIDTSKISNKWWMDMNMDSAHQGEKCIMTFDSIPKDAIELIKPISESLSKSYPSITELVEFYKTKKFDLSIRKKNIRVSSDYGSTIDNEFSFIYEGVNGRVRCFRTYEKMNYGTVKEYHNYKLFIDDKEIESVLSYQANSLFSELKRIFWNKVQVIDILVKFLPDELLFDEIDERLTEFDIIENDQVDFIRLNALFDFYEVPFGPSNPEENQVINRINSI